MRQDRVDKSRRWITGVLCGVLTLVVAIIVISALNQSARASQRAAQIEALSTSLQQGKIQAEKVEQKRVSSALGLSPSRVARDTGVLQTMTSMALTWDSGARYTQARDSLVSRFRVGSDSQFLTSFMPPARYNEDRLGTRHDYIDAIGLNSSSGKDAQVKVVGAQGTTYSYVVLARVTFSSDVAHGGEQSVDQTRQVMLQASVDEDGKIVDLTGHMGSDDVRVSR